LKRLFNKLKLLTGTAGVPPAMSAEREQLSKVEFLGRFSHLTVLVAGGTPAVPVKSLSEFNEQISLKIANPEL
jgi:hypothetical protein